MAGQTDEKAVGGQGGTVGIGDGEAEFAEAILRAGQRRDQQEKKRGVDQGAAQMDSPGSAGGALGIFYRDHERGLFDGSATTFGREEAVAARAGCWNAGGSRGDGDHYFL